MTPTARRILGYIAEHRRLHSISPTLGEIARGVGLAGKSGARPHVVALIESGHLACSSGSRPGYVVSRGYCVTPAGLTLLDFGTCPECGQLIPATTEGATP